MSRKRNFRRHLPVAIGTFIVSSVAVAMVWLINDVMLTDNPGSRKSIQHVTLLTPPPPPPPPPKLEEPPPEPEVEDTVDIPEPETMEELPELPGDEPPPGDLLGLDAEGGAGGDSFGLIGRKGGRSLLDGAGSHMWYRKHIQEDLHSVLHEVEEIRKHNYSVVARLWIDPTGAIERAELQQGSGSPDLDETIRRTLLTAHLAKAPPEGLPQPVRVRITSRL